MKAIFALGNPGPRYRDTRHNAGWWLADRLCARWELPPFREVGRSARTGGDVAGRRVELRKPLTYVNRSGDALRPLLRETGIDADRDLLVLVDDVWLEPGKIRLRAKGSPGGHNGLASVEEALGSAEYPRLRIGVGRPHDDRIEMAAWVLASMPASEEERVLETFDEAAEAVECWMEDGIEAAMNRHN